MSTWQLQAAKAKFSDLVNQCLIEGPQTVTRHGQPAVVVIAAADYARMSGSIESLHDFLSGAPRVELDLSRNDDPDREIDL